MTLAMCAQEHIVISSYIDRNEEKFGVTFEAGRNPDVEFMAHLWEPLRWMHKPLIVYIFAEGIWLSTDCLLRALGFQAYKHQNVSAHACPGPCHFHELLRHPYCSALGGMLTCFAELSQGCHRVL